MSWSYKIARIAGIDVRVHVTFLLLLVLLGFGGYQSGGAPAAIAGTLFILLLFLCVLLHEFGHALAARRYGIRTPDITLLPIGGVARLERMPDNPGQEFVVAIAGPLVNVAIAAGLWAALGFPTRFGDFITFDQPGRELALQMLQVNVGLVLFNLIPAFPMDGGRMLRALLALRLDHARATVIAARVGQGIAILFALVGIFGIPGFMAGNPFLVFIAVFVFIGAQQESTIATMRAAVAGLSVADAMITRFQTLPDQLPVGAAANEALQDTQPVYVITDDRLRVVGMIGRNELLAAAANGNSQPVAALASVVPTAQATDTFDDAFRLMQQSQSPVLPVVNPAGQIIGLISLNLLRERARLRR